MYQVNRLRDRSFNGYRRLVIPHALDEIVDSAVQEYKGADPDTRTAILDALTPRAAGVLSVYGERMAAVAVRTQSLEPLRDGLIGMGMADARLEDPRTNLILLASANHSAEVLGETLARVVEGIAGFLPDPAATTLRDFAARDPRSRSLGAMKVKVRGEGPTFRYW